MKKAEWSLGQDSYMVVNKQLQDVKRFQHAVLARLKAKVSANEIHL